MCVCVQVFGCQLTVEKSFRRKLSLWSKMRAPDTDSSPVRRWLTAEMFNRDERETSCRRRVYKRWTERQNNKTKTTKSTQTTG